MDPRLHKAAKEGNIDLLKQIIEEGNGPDLHLSVTPQKNTAHHIAARFGRHEFAAEILQLCPPLLTQLNSNGDIALHVAARAGQLDLVKLFTENLPKSASQTDIEHGPSNSSADSSLLRMRNLENNTALHEALSNGHEQVALHLLERDPGLAQFVNEAGESPLYLAAEHQLGEVVKKILSRGPSSFSKQGPRGQTPLNAAVFARSLGAMSPPYEVLRSGPSSLSKHEERGQTLSITTIFARSFDFIISTILKMPEIIEMLIGGDDELIKGVDGFGRTALHYAASTGSDDIVHLLLKKDPGLGYVRDNDGLSPLLVAASAKCAGTVGVILDYCPDSAEQLDASGRNALHVAVLKKTVETVKMLLARSEFKELINEPDQDGNTPFHLAVENNHQRMVELLVKVEGVNLKAKNKEGFTALDISESPKEAPSQQVPIRRFLMHHKSARGHHCYVENVIPTFSTPPSEEEPKPDLKAIANNLSLIATLVATISFAAAFTMPGGYNGDEPHQGMATLIKKAAFKAFVVSDTIAVSFSFVSAYMLITESSGAIHRLRRTIGIAETLVSNALLATMIAFVTGVYVVLYDECKWLAILACCIGCSFPLYFAECSCS